MGSSFHQNPMASGGSSSSSARGSPDSPTNGLKFGKKIYFGDVVGLAGPPAPPSSSSKTSSSASTAAAASSEAVTVAAPSAPATSRRGRGFVQSGHPPRCQVEGCWVDLTDAKAYYSRHKVCCMHSKSGKVIVGGIEQRFCQQCSRFHQLPEFDHGKRSCRRRLAGHNERRRKPPAGSLLSSRLGSFSSSIFRGSGGSRNGAFVVDFTSGLKVTGRSLWPETKMSDNHTMDQGKVLQGTTSCSMWPVNTSSAPPGEMFIQGPGGGGRSAGFLGPNPPVSLGEWFAAGVSTDSSCALSLLSNQHWSSENRAPSNQPINLFSSDGSSLGQQQSSTVTHHSMSMGQFSSGLWHYKGGGDESIGLNGDLGLGQVSQHHHPGGFGGGGNDLTTVSHVGGGGGRPLAEAEHAKAYDSTAEYVNWSL